MRTQIDRVLDGMCGLSVIKARWMYTDQDPCVVLVQFYTIHGPVTWMISRDLLWQACEEGHAGDDDYGDVVIDVVESANSLVIERATDSGYGAVAFDARAVRELVNDTWRRVPAGTEFAMVPWDGWLRGVVGA